MRRFSILVLMPLLLLIGCENGITILPCESISSTVEPQVTPVVNIEVLAFTAKWCSICKRDKPQIAEMRRRGVKVTEIDYDKQRSVARKYGVKRLPTYILLQDGEEIERTGSITLIVTAIVSILKIVIPLIAPLFA